MSGSILIIEDEEDLVRSLAYSLTREGFQVRSAFNGVDGLAALKVEPAPDLVLLDLMLPDIPGTEICRRIRSNEATAKCAVIMVTARAAEIDRVVGFEVGADDYVTKPYSTRELVLRIRALLKRLRPEPSAAQELVVGPLRVDVSGHRVWVNDEEIVLTALEFRLLETLIERKGRVQTRDGLLEDVWGYSADVTTRTVDTHIKRLRAKLGDAAMYVETLRGVGYRFRSQP